MMERIIWAEKKMQNLGITDSSKRETPNWSPIWVPDREKHNANGNTSKIPPRQTPNGEEDKTRYKVMGKIKRTKTSQSNFEDYQQEKEDLHIITEDSGDADQTTNEETKQNGIHKLHYTLDSIFSTEEQIKLNEKTSTPQRKSIPPTKNIPIPLPPENSVQQRDTQPIHQQKTPETPTTPQSEADISQETQKSDTRNTQQIIKTRIVPTQSME